MQDMFLLDIAKNGFFVVLITTAPPLLAAMVVGVVVGAFMAATSIQEMTLTFFPKMLAVLGILFVLGNFLFQFLGRFTLSVLSQIPEMVK